MPEFYSLEQPPKEEVKKLTKELREHPKIEPRLTFNFPLNENREVALEMIKSEKVNQEKVIELLENRDFIEKQTGAYLLSKIPKLSGEVGEKALPILEKMSQDKDWDVRQAAAQALGQLGEKALPILEKMSQDEDYWTVRQAAAQARVKIIVETQGEKALPILERMGQNQDWTVRRAAARARVKIIVETQGEKALPILERMGQDQDWVVGEAAARALGQIKGPKFHSWLLATRKPLFAVPETKELAKKFVKLEKIVKKLKKKFKDDFIGIVIFGSTAKGYSEKGSDLDWGIIAKNKGVSEHFKKLARPLKLCSEHYVGVDRNYQTVSNREIPFHGLFFGDQEQLRKLQKTILENIDEKKWDDIRRKIRGHETNLGKAAEKYGLTEDEMAGIKQFISLLRVPPSYRETLKFVQSRR